MTYLTTISAETVQIYPRSIKCHCCKSTGATAPDSRFYAYVDPSLEASEDFLIQKIRSIGEKQICETCTCIKMHDGTLTPERLDGQSFITLQNLGSQIAQHGLKAIADLLLKQHVKSKQLLAKMACIAGDQKEFEIAKSFVKELASSSLSQKDREWVVPILAELGYTEGLQLLLKKGISQDARDKALSYAVHGEHTECLKILLEAGVSPGIIDAGAIHVAKWGQVDALQLFLKAGVSQDGKDRAASFASSNGHVDALKLLLEAGVSQEGKDETAANAVSWGQIESLKLLLEAGLSEEGQSEVVSFATMYGRVDILSFLYEMSGN